MTTADDIDALAGEYVLGTLDAGERAAVAARRLREPSLEAAIRDWEQRLAPLDAATPGAEPPAGLFEKIEARIGTAGTSDGRIVEIAALRRRLKTWRNLAIAASGLAASLVMVIGLRETVYRDAPQSYVAVFQKDDVLPSFYLTINLKTRELTVRPVDAQKQPGKTYQLWIASEQLGPAPQSLGLVDENLGPTRKQLTSYDANLLQRATFGVSLEPAGGSPTGRPTSPALHAKLLPVTQ
ncbi:MAG: anti-sigma factor domain-containing protein [Hyphomicrobiaceae bacterium]